MYKEKICDTSVASQPLYACDVSVNTFQCVFFVTNPLYCYFIFIAGYFHLLFYFLLQDIFTSLSSLSKPNSVEELYCFQYRSKVARVLTSVMDPWHPHTKWSWTWPIWNFISTCLAVSRPVWWIRIRSDPELFWPGRIRVWPFWPESLYNFCASTF